MSTKIHNSGLSLVENKGKNEGWNLSVDYTNLNIRKLVDKDSVESDLERSATHSEAIYEDIDTHQIDYISIDDGTYDAGGHAYENQKAHHRSKQSSSRDYPKFYNPVHNKLDDKIHELQIKIEENTERSKKKLFERK